jgi:hypothetical protein
MIDQDGPSTLRVYYRRAEPDVSVEAAQIIAAPHPLSEAVRVRDLNGMASAVSYAGLFRDGVPDIGDWVLLWQRSGKTEWIARDRFAAEWAPAVGPVLF